MYVIIKDSNVHNDCVLFKPHTTSAVVRKEIAERTYHQYLCMLYRASHRVSSGLILHNVHCMYPCSSLLFRSHSALLRCVLEMRLMRLYSLNAWPNNMTSPRGVLT